MPVIGLRKVGTLGNTPLSWLLHGKDVKISENYRFCLSWTTDLFRDITE